MRFWRFARFWIIAGLLLTLVGIPLGFWNAARLDTKCNTDLVQDGRYMERLLGQFSQETRQACAETRAQRDAQAAAEQQEASAGSDASMTQYCNGWYGETQYSVPFGSEMQVLDVLISCSEDGSKLSVTAIEDPASEETAKEDGATEASAASDFVGPCQAGPSSAPRGNTESAGNGKAPQTVQEAVQVLGVVAECLTPIREAHSQLVTGWKIGDAPYEVVFQANIHATACVDHRTSQSGGKAFTGNMVSSDKVDWSRTFAESSGVFQGSEATVYWTECDMSVFQDQQTSASASTAPANQAPAPTASPGTIDCPVFDGVQTIYGNDGSDYCKLEWSDERGTVTDEVPAGWYVQHDGQGSPSSAGVTATFGSGTFRPID